MTGYISESINKIKNACGQTGDRIILCGHDRPDLDSILSCILMKKLLRHFGISSEIRFQGRIDPDAHTALGRLGIDAEQYIGEINGSRTVLLDHNVRVNCHTILAVDHHPVVNVLDYPVIADQTASSCAKMIYDYLDFLKIADNTDLLFAVYSVCCDTYAMKSTKTNPEDITWFWESCRHLGLDGEMICRESLCLDNPNGDPALMCKYGFKEFWFPNGKIAASYAKSDTPELMPTERMLEILEGERVALGYLLWEFMLCDPVHEKTQIFWLDSDGCHREFANHIVSRSREIIPRLENMAKAKKYLPCEEKL